MLGKLLKHEFKTINRLMIPMHLTLLAVTILQRTCTQGIMATYEHSYMRENPWSGTIGISLVLLYVLALAAIGIISQLYLLVLRPRKNFFTDEGYLTHTLPVSASLHIISKLLAAFIWSLLDVIFILMSIFSLFVNREFFQEFSRIVQSLKDTFPSTFGISLQVGLPLFLFYLLFVILARILSIYMCMAIGHSFSSHKILASVGCYIAYSVLTSTLTNSFQVLQTNRLYGITLLARATLAYGDHYFLTTMLFGILFYAVICVAAFVVTRYFISRKLNLE